MKPPMDFKEERDKALLQYHGNEITYSKFEDRIFEIAGAEMAYEIDCEIMNDIVNELAERVKTLSPQ